MIADPKRMDEIDPLAEVRRHPDIVGDMKKLRKFPKPDASLESWEMLFSAKGLNEVPGINRYPGFGKREIYKARVLPLGEKVGKSSGYRLIFERLADGAHRILIFSRHGQYKHERELQQLIRERLME